MHEYDLCSRGLYPSSTSPDGIVIYVNPATRTGIAVALTDAVPPTPGVSWENTGGGTSALGLGAENPIDPATSVQQTTSADYYLYNNNATPPAYSTTGITAGQANTSTILIVDYAKCTTATGATGCAAYAATTYLGGYAGHTGTNAVGTWYLPSVTEISLVQQQDAANFTAQPRYYTKLVGTSKYWSSTEFSGNTGSAWLVVSTYGAVANDKKFFQFGVRAVRAFTY